MLRRQPHPMRNTREPVCSLMMGSMETRYETSGLPRLCLTAELCRQHGISEQTYYRWKAKYGGMDSGEAKRLKQLEDENRKLKHVVADLTLDNRALKDVLSKNW